MKIKVSETTPIQLDWLVAKIEGITHHVKWLQTSPPACYSTDWSQGGPIIEREKLELFDALAGEAAWKSCNTPVATEPQYYFQQYGPTPLIAAMRCFCCSKMGDVVDIPEELCQQQSS